MKITDVDRLEQDAFLEVGDKRHYFQYSIEPTIERALIYLVNEGTYTLEEAQQILENS